jgi:hypothetical protein
VYDIKESDAAVEFGGRSRCFVQPQQHAYAHVTHNGLNPKS